MSKVEGFGPSDARIIILGSAPELDDLRANRPFVGGTGKMLRKLAESAALSIDDCYCTYVIKERPDRGRVSDIISFPKEGVIETPRYVWNCIKLLKEIREHPANLIIALGNVPLYTLLSELPLLGLTMGIRKRRGSIYWSKLFDKKVLCVMDPADLVHGDFMDRYPMMEDLKRAHYECKTKELKQTQYSIISCPSFDKTITFLNSTIANDHSTVAFDIEVINQEVSCFSFALSSAMSICIPLSHQGEHYFTPDQEIEVWNAVAELLATPTITLVGMNLMFDLAFIRRKFGIITRCQLDDIMIARGILVPDLRKGLGVIVAEYCNTPYYKDDGKESGWGADQDYESFYRYNAMDSMVCLEALPKLLADLEKQGNMPIYRKSCELIPVLVEMQERGMRLDNKAIAEGRTELVEDAITLETEITNLIGRKINVNSNPQLCKYFYDELGHKPYLDRQTGKPCVDKIALRRLVRKKVPIAGLVEKTRKLYKMLNTYFRMILDDDKRLRGSFNIAGTVTGRLSSSASIFGTGGNLQNLPFRFHQHVQADEDYVLYSVDLSNAENRLVAYLADEPRMIHAFEKGIDIHAQTAASIFNKPIEEISDVDGSASELGDGTESERAWGKRTNHGLNYGLGYRGFALKAGVLDNIGKRIFDIYHEELYPNVHRWHESIRIGLFKSRNLTNLFGRRRLFLGPLGENLNREAFNYIPQSTIADILNQWGLLFIDKTLSKFGYVQLLNQIHDSIVFQISLEQDWSDHALIITDIIKNLQKPLTYKNHTFTIPAEVKIGSTYGNLSSVNLDGDLALALEQTYSKAKDSIDAL